MTPRRTLLVCVAILALAAGLILVIFNTEPSATKSGATKQTAMLVDVITVESGDYRPIFEATGTVRAENEVILQPRVAGEVINRSDAFTPGTVVKRGQRLLTIDPADFETTVRRREAELAQAEADLALERGRQEVAAEDYALLGDEMADDMDTSLVLRKPQLQAAEARVAAAQADLRRARLDLQRTRVNAPFDALVLERQANVGSQVGPGDVIGRLVGVDRFWVELSVPVSRLRWLRFPDTNDAQDTGSAVKIHNRAAWAPEVFRKGELDQLVGELTQQTRLARILITVDDPLARAADGPRLLVGAFVQASIEGEPIPDVVRLSREHLRKGDTAWVMTDDNTLRIQPLEILLKDADYAYVRSGIDAGDRVVTSQLATATDGAALRRNGTPAP
ncbi:efflux RND transporter periplasmic adaptor subunit [Algiphilus sp.]|uniref:efflux RND transporter periplasmic adaptor subunit n=1 Tax=Algiphilus sp. TaxID=1872431 RepID=UPI003B52A262